MNYLYALLESESCLAASALGLDSGLGVLHVDTPHRDSLALDLMEPVRPQVDSYAIDSFLRGLIRREWFFEERNGNARLMAAFAAQLSQTAPIWGRAVAPIAEWVAQALWSSSRSRDNRKEVVPTRLTQRRRTEGRGNEFSAKKIPIAYRVKICEVCGAEGVQSRYCRSCAVDVSRENMAQVALIGHARPKTQRIKNRISKTISDHAVANTWFDPKSLPSWLTEECYVQRIQPLLRGRKVREIAEAMQVSQPYAALIRSGRRRPHPRHWLALARLVGYLR